MSYSYGRRATPAPKKTPVAGIVTATVFVIAVVGVFAWLWGLNILHLFTFQLRESAIFWTPAGIGAAVLIAAFLFTKKPGVHALAITVAVISIVAGLVLSIFANYERLRVYYTQSSTQVEQVAPDYADRVPFEVASNMSDAEMQDLTGDAQATKSLSDASDHGIWNTLVHTRGPFNGYEAVQTMDLPLFDSETSPGVDNCRFEENAKLRDGGALPHNNLSRAIYGMVPLDVDYDFSDAYGYCQDGVPYVAVPLKQVQGWFYPTHVFYGVAVYNGTTGELTIADTAEKVAEIPGPIYPMSLAAVQREALAANEGWWEMAVSQTSGYTAATSNTEVQLRRDGDEDGASDYVTTLTPRGSSKSIIGVSHIPATSGTPGARNTLTVALLPDGQTRASNKSLTDSLRGRYSHLADIANDKLQVFEVTASTEGRWVLTLGRELAVSYRAYVSGDGKQITLINRRGDVVAQNYGAKDSDEGDGEGTLTPVPGADLGELSDAELAELGKAIFDELAERGATE